MIQAESENLHCPRCDSPNTKFCYYNNYNLTQPRHFCKTCRRYWTKGGALRNVPIGGASRKNKTPTTAAAAKLNPLPAHPMLWGSPQSGTHSLPLLRPNQNPSLKEEGMMYASESNARALDPFAQARFPSVPIPVDSLYRSRTGPGQGISDGLQEVYPEHAPVILGSTASGILESSPVAAAPEFGFWNIPALDFLHFN